MVVAYPVGSARLREIEAASLLHVSKSRYRDQIITSTDARDLPAHANCRIHLKAGQGWSVAPFRLLRDLSVLDPFLTKTKAYGRYTYFFLGDPSWWARTKNISWGYRTEAPSEGTTVYRIEGRDLLSCADLLFFRPDDKVVVIRGDYIGPAIADPAP